MLSLPVPPQIHLALEAFATQITAKGLEARVLPTVGDEVGALTEGFSTHLALVRLLTCRQKVGKREAVKEATCCLRGTAANIHCYLKLIKEIFV